MTTAIQPVSSAYTVSVLPAPSPISQLARKANSLLFVPSVILTLGATSPAPITYNAAGLFESLLQVADTSQGASGSTTTPVATANTAGTATAAATGSSTTLVGDLAALLGFNITTTGSGLLNASPSLQSLPATTAQALTALLAPDSNPLSSAGAGTLTVNQTLARQVLIDLYSTATGLETTTAASVSGATDILQGLPSNSTVQSINKLLSTDLGLSAAALLDSTGIAATTTTIGSNGNWITTLAPTANSTGTDSRSAVDSLLLANVEPTSASTGAVSGGTTVTTVSTDTVSSTIPFAAAAPAAATPAATVTATPTTAAPETSSAAASNATLTPVAVNAGSTPDAANALSDNFLLDSVAQALANIGGNPAYANTVAGLYMSAVIFHTQHASADSLTSTADEVQPVTAVQNASAVKLVKK